MFSYLIKGNLFFQQIISFTQQQSLRFIAVNAKACFPLYIISYLIDENCTKRSFQRYRGEGEEEALFNKGNLSVETERSDNTEIFVVKFKYAAKMSLVSPPEYDK